MHHLCLISEAVLVLLLLLLGFLHALDLFFDCLESLVQTLQLILRTFLFLSTSLSIIFTTATTITSLSSSTKCCKKINIKGNDVLVAYYQFLSRLYTPQLDNPQKVRVQLNHRNCHKVSQH